MSTYEITATVRPDLVESYEAYMLERHIPDLLATGCFESASLERASAGRYRIRYEAPDRPTLDAYLDEHAARLRADFAAHFPEGVEVAREIWERVQRWTGSPPGCAP